MKTNSLNHCALSGFKNYFELYLSVGPHVHTDNEADFLSLRKKQGEYMDTCDLSKKYGIVHKVNTLFIGMYQEMYGITDVDLTEEIGQYWTACLECHANLSWLNKLDPKYPIYPIKSYETHLQEVAQSVSDGFEKCTENISKMYESIQQITR